MNEIPCLQKHGISYIINYMIKKFVKDTILKYDLLEKGDHVIVGLSGGPDSMCLFYVLLDLKDEFELNISAVHVNHMLRPGDAEKDQEYVESICKKMGIICKVSVRDCAKIAKEQGITDEEAGRNIRYEAFYDAAKELITGGIPAGKIKIAVAQNKNDQAETLLMRIMRGTGVNGLSGIEYKRAGGQGASIIRPLLDAGRTDIENYCIEKNINPRIDHTNEQPVYTRNKIRLELIPYIAENFNENIIDSLARLAQSAKEDTGYLWEQAGIAYQSLKKAPDCLELFIDAEKMVVLDRAGLRKLGAPIRRRVIFTAFQKIGLMQDISASHLNMIDHIILSENASAKVNLPDCYEMSVSYDNAVAYVRRDGEIQDFTERPKLSDNSLNNPFEPNFKIKILNIDEYDTEKYDAGRTSEQRHTAAFDYGRLKEAAQNAEGAVEGAITVRSREPGDYFTPQGMKSGKKKIQDYFVDRKVPKENRDYYKLIALGKEILWVFDPRYHKHNEINERYKITGGTKQVLVLEIERKL